MKNGQRSLQYRGTHKIALGAALVELAIVLPIILLLIAGLIVMGNLINQSLWFSQTVYQAVYAGAQTDPGVVVSTPGPNDPRILAAAETARRMIEKQNPSTPTNPQKLFERRQGIVVSSNALEQAEVSSNALTLAFATKAINFWKGDVIPFSSSIRGPLLRRPMIPVTSANFVGSSSPFTCCGNSGSSSGCVSTAAPYSYDTGCGPSTDGSFETITEEEYYKSKKKSP